MPDGYRGFFTDNEEGPQFGKHTGEELLAFVERNFSVRPAREARAIGGFSMGGYGAFQIGLSYCDRFCSIHSNAGSLDRRVDFTVTAEEQSGILKQRPDSFIAEMRRVFGPKPLETRHDVFKLAVEAQRRGALPKLWIDCGIDDYLLEGTRLFQRDLEQAGIPHVYHENPGSHNWDYCDAQLETVLAFHARNLGIGAFPPAPKTGRE
jgi:S-formylglutathione hydrolase FrmB